MKLFAVSDLHLGCLENREVLDAIPAHPDDWLVLAGDVGERLSHLELALTTLTPRFRQVVWVPGNHDLWSTSSAHGEPRGVAKYETLVELSRDHDVLTPEDPYPVVSFGGVRTRVAPLFLLYDYSFRPPDVSFEEALAWARASGVECADEALLSPEPYASRAGWCHVRCDSTYRRLAENCEIPTVIANHFPLLESLARTPRIPRFSLWCGTRRTADWHRRFNVKAVIYGHLHIPSTRYVDGVRFEEVSLGYPRQWMGRRDPVSCLREILPGPHADAPAHTRGCRAAHGAASSRLDASLNSNASSPKRATN